MSTKPKPKEDSKDIQNKTYQRRHTREDIPEDNNKNETKPPKSGKVLPKTPPQSTQRKSITNNPSSLDNKQSFFSGQHAVRHTNTQKQKHTLIAIHSTETAHVTLQEH